MIGKIIGAYVGSKAAKKSSALGGPAGAALGVIAPMVLRRISIPAMAAMAVGGYFMKKVLDNGERDGGTKRVRTATPFKSTPTVTPTTPAAIAPPVTD